MNKLFLVCFANLYMFRAYLDPSSGGTTVCLQQLVFIILFRRLSVFLANPTRKTGSHLKRTISTNCCIHTVVPPDDGPRYARNRGWRNILRISCVSSWCFLTWWHKMMCICTSLHFYILID